MDQRFGDEKKRRKVEVRRAEKTKKGGSKNKQEKKEVEEEVEGGDVAKAAARSGLTFLQIRPPFKGFSPGQVRGQK